MGIVGRFLRVALGVVLIAAAAGLVVLGLQTIISPSPSMVIAYAILMSLTFWGIAFLLGMIGYACIKVLWKKQTVFEKKVDKPIVTEISRDVNSPGQNS